MSVHKGYGASYGADGTLQSIVINDGPTRVTVELRDGSTRVDVFTSERYAFAIYPKSENAARIVAAAPVEQEAKP